MGVDVDLKPGQPIVAPGNSRVLGIMQGWYSGQPYLALQLLDGPMKGRSYYVAEQINIAVTVGQIVQQGQPIAHYAASGTGIEIGWAGADWQQTLAQASGNTGDSSHGDAPAGVSFKAFLDSLSQHAAPSVPAGSGLAQSGGSSAQGSVNVDLAQASLATAGSAASQSAAGTQGAAGAAAAGAQGAAGASAAAGAQVPARPVTAAFQAVGRHAGSPPRHTVQFLAAVQPAAGDPSAAAPAVGTQPAAEAAGAQPVTQQMSGQAQAGQPGVVPQAIGQIQSAGTVISVSSSKLTGGQEIFAAHLAALTGLDPRVIAAWELAEESGGAAQLRQAASNFNWLNIGYFDSGTGQIAADKAFADPVSAAEQTARFLKGSWGGASSSIRAILANVNHTPEEQIMGIANSDWASSHYGGGADLKGTYDELSGLKVQTSPGTVPTS